MRAGLAALMVPALLAASPAGAATAAAPAKPPETARWQLIEGTDQVAGGIGLRWLKIGGDTDTPVGLLACRRPSGIYVSADGIPLKAAAPAIDLLVSGKGFAVPVGSPAQEGKSVEAVGATPAGLLDALETAGTIQLMYGAQSSGVFLAPDARVMQGFITVCRQIEGEHGQGG